MNYETSSMGKEEGGIILNGINMPLQVKNL
jgi:hypothetical protein